MKTIILAAGTGSRIQELLKGKPKPLLEICGKSLLEHSLDALIRNSIKEIGIVTGFNGEAIKQKIGEKFGGVKINYLFNEIYEKTGSMHSLFKALGEPEECLVLDGDIVYDPRVISGLINFPKKDSVFLAPLCKSGDEVYVVLDDSGAITHLSKKIQEPLKSNYEFTGISKFSKEFIIKMTELHAAQLSRGNFSDYYEDCAFKAANFIPWYGYIDENLAWSEVDKKEDIKRAEKVIKRIGSGI